MGWGRFGTSGTSWYVLVRLGLSGTSWYVWFVKIPVHAQDSCACTTLLCMHYTLVHALGQGTQGPGTKPVARDQAWDPKRRGPGPWPLAWQPGSLAQCMHKSVVHAQRVLCMHKNLDIETPVLGRCAASGVFLFKKPKRLKK